MDPNKISELANLLKNNGDKVLNSKFKLTLTGSLLRALNDSFTLIADSTELSSKQVFQVVKPNNSKSNVFRDLQLVHDFVQKTLILCITSYSRDDIFDGIIDVSKFRSLVCLEIQKTNINQIIGIQRLRSQLQQLVCVRCLDSLVEIIENCGGDQSNGFVWNELKSADFSYNNLKTVDSSLEFAQYLQHLNLKHNQLISVEAIKWLPNLKTLDLSYNKLTKVPYFHVETLRRLQSLNLSNNLIEDLNGVSKLDLLTELDLSDNCLLDHSVLYPLSSLMTLKYLNLCGNPLFYHTNHRIAAAQFLHRDTRTVKFLLNCEPLSTKEKLSTGTHYRNAHSRYVNKNVLTSSSHPIRQSYSDETPTSSVGSKKSFQGPRTSKDHEKTSSITEKAKRVKVRQVIIECPEQMTNTSPKQKNFQANVNKDHLETKTKFMTLRNKYGAGWLQNENAPIIQNVSDQSPFDNLQTKEQLNPKETMKEAFHEYLDEGNSTKSLEITNNNTESDLSSIFEKQHSTESHSADENEHINEPLDIAPHLENIYVNSAEDDKISDVEADEQSYAVQLLETKEPLLLTLSSNYIREKQVLNEKTKSKWSLKVLQSCDRIKSNTLRINFDTMKMDKKERIYTINEELCQELEKKLRAILSERNLGEMNQAVFRCINCSCQFSEENGLDKRRNRNHAGIFCPDCKSTFVTEIHGLATNLNDVLKTSSKDEKEEYFTKENKPDIAEECKLLTFESESSMQEIIGSNNSLNESSLSSKISQTQGSFNSSQSATDREINSKTHCDSDVDVISNPSQSSIEVLDEIQTSLKNSEDEDATSQENLKTSRVEVKNSEKTIPSEQVHLIESSSSGSITDSVCTTYGGNLTPNKSQINETHLQHVQLSNEESARKEESKLSSVLGGLLESTNMLMSRTSQLFIEPGSSPTPCEKYNFNYIDFSDVDHRIKFYFYQVKFKERSEHFKWLVKGKLFNENTQTIVDGIVVMSTIKCYVMEEFGPENDNISKWLRPIVSVTADRLESIQLLPWKVGLYFMLRDWGGFLLLLQDILRTDSLLFHLRRNELPAQCELNYHVSEKVLRRLSTTLGDEQLTMFSLLNSCEVKRDNNIQTFCLPGLLTTDSRLFVTTSNLSWLTLSADCPIEIGSNQLMSNLVDVQKPEENICILNFYDETKNTTELWKCTFETKENGDSCLNAIGQSWEKLFGVLFNS